MNDSFVSFEIMEEIGFFIVVEVYVNDMKVKS